MAEETATNMEQAGEEGDQETVTLGEVLQSEQQLMEDANAVLGALDDKKCTYAEGYMKRQALYSCLTCIPEAKTDPTKAAGICLACCYYCHEGHELIELYTKRNFRCDCGNSKFPNSSCNLDSSKTDLNELNQYNQNFTGLYCTCTRPYPDPEDSVDDEMIQCIICEDWYHSRHLGVDIPPQNSYSEVTCETCIKKHPFLLHYEGLCVNKVEQNELKIGEQNDVNVTAGTEEVAVASTSGDNSCAQSVNKPEVVTEQKLVNTSEVPNNCDSTDVPLLNGTDTTLASLVNGLDTVEVPMNFGANDCKMPKIKSTKVSSKFWADVEWRKHLCTCLECLKMYEEQKVMFLIDPQDPVQVYEEKGKAKAREFEAKQHENDMKFINSLDRVPLMEAIAGFNDLKTNLMEYLKKFAENKKVVREEDIREFFSNYDMKKKQKCEVPHYCR